MNKYEKSNIFLDKNRLVLILLEYIELVYEINDSFQYRQYSDTKIINPWKN